MGVMRFLRRLAKGFRGGGSSCVVCPHVHLLVMGIDTLPWRSVILKQHWLGEPSFWHYSFGFCGADGRPCVSVESIRFANGLGFTMCDGARSPPAASPARPATFSGQSREGGGREEEELGDEAGDGDETPQVLCQDAGEAIKWAVLRGLVQINGTQGVVFVVRGERVEDDREELRGLFSQIDELAGLPLLVLARDCCWGRPITAPDVALDLGVPSLSQPGQWKVQMVSSKSGAELMGGLDWLKERIPFSNPRSLNAPAVFQQAPA